MHSIMCRAPPTFILDMQEKLQNLMKKVQITYKHIRGRLNKKSLAQLTFESKNIIRSITAMIKRPNKK